MLKVLGSQSVTKVVVATKVGQESVMALGRPWCEQRKYLVRRSGDWAVKKQIIRVWQGTSWNRVLRGQGVR